MLCSDTKAWLKIKPMNSLPTAKIHSIAIQLAIKIIAASAIFVQSTGHAYAQQVYKSIDKQGRVTYSQIPPKPGSEEKLTGSGAENPALPFVLQQVVKRYPVTLYTTTDSPYSVTARLYLLQRGIPFTEKTVVTAEDFVEFKQRSFENIFPTLTIGNQQLKGFNDIEWSQYLNAAGYPAQSALPRNYSNPAATPLVAVKKVADKANANGNANTAPAATATTTPKTAPEPARTLDPSNPTGIRF